MADLRIEPYGPYRWDVEYQWLGDGRVVDLSADMESMTVFTKELNIAKAYEEAESSLSHSGQPFVITGIDLTEMPGEY